MQSFSQLWRGLNGAAIGLAAGWLSLLLVLASTAVKAEAEVDPYGPWPHERNALVELVADKATVAPGERLWLALDQEIRPGWHTYWKYPGDSGEPTQVLWSPDLAVAPGPIQWPAPNRLPFAHLVNFGYSNHVLLAMPVDIPADAEPGTELTFAGDAVWLVCADICIPEQAAVKLTLPVTEAPGVANSLWAPKITAQREALPQPSPFETRFDASQEALEIALLTGSFARAFDKGSITRAEFYPDEGGFIDNAAPQAVRYGPDGVTWRIGAGTRLKSGDVPAELSGVLVLEEALSDGPSVSALQIEALPGEIPRGAAAQPFGPPAAGLGNMSLWQAAVFAFLGGLILNLMPCVFPVLFLKGLSFAKAAAYEPWAVRSHGLAFTAGVILSFMAIAGLLLALRAGEAAVGWGFQLQSPVVVSGLALLMFVIGLSLTGLLTIGSSVSGVGSSLANRSGLSGSFFTGVLAVVVAAPCTAPFMAGAIGWAIFQPVAVALAVFAALGLGMAAPWLLLSLSPALARLLPKPGAWMDRLKQILSVPMFLTAAWLVWVLEKQAGLTSVGIVLGAMAVLTLVAFGAWALTRRKGAGAGGAAPLAAGAVAAVAALIAVPQFASTPQFSANADGTRTLGGLDWEVWAPEKIEAGLDAGRTVFVDFTAAWCITCLVNEERVLRDPDIVRLFQDRNVLALHADWTNRDPAITAALEEFGRTGVPLYLVYGPGGGVEVLPQILTAQRVRAAIADAGPAATAQGPGDAIGASSGS